MDFEQPLSPEESATTIASLLEELAAIKLKAGEELASLRKELAQAKAKFDAEVRANSEMEKIITTRQEASIKVAKRALLAFYRQALVTQAFRIAYIMDKASAICQNRINPEKKARIDEAAMELKALTMSSAIAFGVDLRKYIEAREKILVEIIAELKALSAEGHTYQYHVGANGIPEIMPSIAGMPAIMPSCAGMPMTAGIPPDDLHHVFSGMMSFSNTCSARIQSYENALSEIARVFYPRPEIALFPTLQKAIVETMSSVSPGLEFNPFHFMMWITPLFDKALADNNISPDRCQKERKGTINSLRISFFNEINTAHVRNMCKTVGGKVAEDCINVAINNAIAQIIWTKISHEIKVHFHATTRNALIDARVTKISQEPQYCSKVIKVNSIPIRARGLSEMPVPMPVPVSMPMPVPMQVLMPVQVQVQVPDLMPTPALMPAHIMGMFAKDVARVERSSMPTQTATSQLHLHVQAQAPMPMPMPAQTLQHRFCHKRERDEDIESSEVCGVPFIPVPVPVPALGPIPVPIPARRQLTPLVPWSKPLEFPQHKRQVQ